MQAFLRPAGDRQAPVWVRTISMAEAVQPGVGRATDAGEAPLNFLTTNPTPEGVFPYMIRKLKAGDIGSILARRMPRRGSGRSMSGRCSISSGRELAKAAVYSAVWRVT
jgi:hypothetical protein